MAHGELPPINITPGAIRFNTDSMKLEYFRIGMEGGTTSSYAGIGTLAAGEWVQLTTDSPDVQTGGTRGLIASGNTNSDKIEYANLATTGGITTFGDIGGSNGAYRTGTADRTRAVFFNAQNATDSQFVTIASTGNSATHTTMPNDYNQVASCSDGVRGLIAGGSISGSAARSIEYITLSTLGNAVNFGALTGNANSGSNGACSSPTRALFASIANNDTTNYVQIMHEGEAVQFGDLGLARNYTGTTSNGHGGLG